ncbi:MAG: hypothetical protein Fur0027_13140 [Raineya sp.]
MKPFAFFLLLLLSFACGKTEQKEEPVSYKPHFANPEKPIAPIPNDGSFFGYILFDKKDEVHIILPDSTEIIAEQSSPTTRKYYLAADRFLIFSTKNYKNGFRLFSNDNKALWQIDLQEDGIKVKQQGKGMSKNNFEISIQKNGLLLIKDQNNEKIGKVVLQQKKAVFYKKDKPVFTIETDMLSPAFGVLLIEEMGIEEKYAVFAEAFARGY